MSKPAPVVTSHVAPLTSVERLTAAGRVIRALQHMPAEEQAAVLAIIATNAANFEAMYRLLSILRHLSLADFHAVLSSAQALVGQDGGEA